MSDEKNSSVEQVHPTCPMFFQPNAVLPSARRGRITGEGRDSPTLLEDGTMNRLEGVKGKFGSILIDPPWRFSNRTGKIAPEHTRLKRYETLSFEQIKALPLPQHARKQSHLYMWCPNALLMDGLRIMDAWGFTYKTNIVWYKIRKDGGPDGRGVGFYFRNVTELVLFGVKGKLRTLQPGRRQVNVILSRKQEHSRKPENLYDIIEQCSPGPYLEMFARERRKKWTAWGDEVDTYLENRPVYRAYTTVGDDPRVCAAQSSV